MADPKLSVIAESEILRESVAIALAQRYVLTSLSPHQAIAALPACDLVILETPAADAARGAVDAAGVAVLPITNGAPPADPDGLAFPFYPEALRAAVRRALETPRPGRAPTPAPPGADLDAPLIPATAAAVAAKAVATGLPALIGGARGSGARRLARQIHARAGGGRFLAIPATRFDAELAATLRADRDERLTVCIDRIETMPAEAMEQLAGLLDDGTFDQAGGPRLLCTAETDPDDIVASSGIDPDLFYRFAVLPIHLPPLRSRLTELPAIATAVLARLAARLAPQAGPRLDGDALARLARYPWPGNLAELETVLTRTLVFRRNDTIGAPDLLFDIAAAAAVPAAPATRQPEPDGRREAPEDDRRASELDLLVHELAHELKNPMVTIKTVAQHLERLLDEESGQREMARLTGEAVDRMDRTLENLLEYTRFTEPVRCATRLADIVGDCFDALDSEFVAHRILVDDRVAPESTVLVDPAQMTYALVNLLRAIVRTAGDGTTLVVRSPLSRSGLDLEFPTTTASVTAALARWSNGTPATTAISASVAFVFARTLLERNGGALEVRPGDGKTTVRVTLPAGEGSSVRVEEAEEDEEAAYPDR